ncbi:MAG: penicillin-binding protein 2 [Puniceicoccales bacterium]|jgi:cell division protein FtsI/penicillin-binding protein 2|nr:penicillin-binding protein 2 [Puniceicoccales bacterium]
MLPLCSKRYLLLPSTFAFGFIVLGARTLHLYQHRHTYQDTLQARHRTYILNAQRGKIFDSTGQCLASNRRVYEIGVDLTQVQEKDLFQLAQLAKLLKVSLSHLESIWNFNAACRWKKIRDNVPESIYQKICALQIKGVYGNAKNLRVYFDTHSLGHIIGFVDREGQSICGIERSMHFYLNGQVGENRLEMDGKRNELVQFRTHAIVPQHGHNIEITLDTKIQALVAQILEKADQQYHPKSIQALVTRPRSGEILALVVYPGFDPNHYGRYPPENLKNKVVSDVYEPGSVFKAITVSAALDAHSVQETDVFDCGSQTAEYKGKMLPLPKDWKPFNQRMSVADILSHSSNRGIVQVAFKLGADKLFDYGQRFGFGESTKSGFAGETRGILHPPNQWDGLTITRLPIGHALACSLIQMHYAMGAIANDGKLMYPQLVKRIYDSNGEIIRTFLPVVRRQVIQEQTAKKMRQLLTHTASSKAYIPHYFVAGKTGTSQKIIDGKYSHTQHVSSISGFFPSQNPQIQITITVDSPQSQGTAYGAQIASPIFKEIAEGIIAYLGIPPESHIS